MKGIIIWIIIQAMMIILKIQKKKKRLNISTIELLNYWFIIYVFLINGKNNHHGADILGSNVIVTKKKKYQFQCKYF